MISKNIRGRLGNQFFQYAAMRYIQEVNGNNDELALNFSKYVYSKNFNNDLKFFNVKEYDEVDKIKISFKQKILILYFRIIKKIIMILDKKNYYYKRQKIENKYSKILIKNGLYWKEDGKLNIQPTKKNNKVVIGHFESKENFDKIREKLLVEFSPKAKPLDKNKELYSKIENSNSICISIRRGDFVLNVEFSKKFNVCGIDYFYKSIELMKRKVENPVFILFSDDIEWCKENIKIDGEVLYESGDDPVWEKLRMMYSCKHFIISNSTFSWWAQYLSRNDKKIVIAPKKWSNSGFKDDIYDPNWILVDN